MYHKIRNAAHNWRGEIVALALGVGLLISAPTLVQASACNPGDQNHLHSGADHCDSGGSGCTVVCP